MSEIVVIGASRASVKPDKQLIFKEQLKPQLLQSERQLESNDRFCCQALFTLEVETQHQSIKIGEVGGEEEIRATKK